MTGQRETDADPAAVGQVMGRLMADLAATSGMLLTLAGVRTGLWESLAAGPATPGELAARLRAAIRTGTACTYQPAQPVDWDR